MRARLISLPSGNHHLPWLVLLLFASGCMPRGAAQQDASETKIETKTQNTPGEAATPAAADDAAPASQQANQRPRNRLASETSPYLLLHAHNPVDWYGWGEEALAKAKAENKLIFLSIGYSSCHWCHVMERESFMDEEIAAFLNQHYVCIKVDREERPDIDSIYMTAVQALTRRGGWPLSVFLTPDAKPFYGGTYFPARDDDRPGMPGFLTLVKRVQEVWNEKPDDVRQQANQLAEYVKSEMDGRRPESLTPPGPELLDRVYEGLASQYDADHGGFGYSPANPAQPKFPEPSNLLFLIDRIQQKRAAGQDDQAGQEREMLVHSLERMAMGGIRDHLGGGFHRYSVDRFWHIPHFEKMLYDNGQLATVYTEAYLLTGREDFRRVVEALLAFVANEMTAEEGAFYSALDADSEGEEGRFYRWEKQQVHKLLGDDSFALFAAIYGLDAEPNFEQQFYVLQLDKPLRASAVDKKLSEDELETQLQPLRQKLLEARQQRVRPLTDNKILTSWNGLMIRGFADTGRGLQNQRYLDAARRAADFALGKLRNPEGRLQRTYAQGQAKLNGYLNDYAFMIDGLIALYRATGERKWLDAAAELTELQIQLFWDDDNGGFFFTSDDHESLLARGKDPADGAQPSGNSVSAQNLIFLATELDKPEYLDRAERTIKSISGLMDRVPTVAPRMAVAVSELLAAKAKGANQD